MSRNQQLLDEAMALPPEERAELAEKLLESLDAADQKEIDAAWAEEAQRRLGAVETGQMGTLPAQEAFRRLKERKP